MIYTAQRKKMVERLRSAGISDTRVLDVMERIPRHEFVAAGMEFQAYDEKALPIGFEQTISHPYTVALMSQALEVKKGQRILEIGTGSGYQTAVLCELGAQVFTIEKVAALGKFSAKRLKRFRYHVVQRVGDGTLGWQSYAPFDSIIVTAGAPVAPETLMNQLKENGRLLIPVGHKDKQILTLFFKQGNTFKTVELETLSFVPLKGKEGW
jgi:protein-L-isoaspartate(D-aspartate) O-methyltransferase